MHLCYRTLFISSELFLSGFLIQEVWFLFPFPIMFSLQSSLEGTKVQLSSYSRHVKVAQGMSWDLLKVSMLALGCSYTGGQLCLALWVQNHFSFSSFWFVMIVRVSWNLSPVLPIPCRLKSRAPALFLAMTAVYRISSEKCLQKKDLPEQTSGIVTQKTWLKLRRVAQHSTMVLEPRS